MEESSQRISLLLDEIISNELLIGEELRGMLQTFKEEKKYFPFGTLCITFYYEYSGSEDDRIYLVAAAIELIILSFDIIDDLQDQDTYYIWTETPALSLNVVITMLILALKLIGESTFKYRSLALKIVEEYTLTSISGQHLDLLNICNDETSYLQMIEQKSGSLTAMSCLVGIALAKGKRSTEVEQFAKCIGVIQQIKNDIHSFKSSDVKNDLLNRKYSLPIIYFFSLEKEISKELQKYYKGMEVEFSQDNIMNELIDSGAFRYALAIKNLYRNRAINFFQHEVLSKETKQQLKKLMK